MRELKIPKARVAVLIGTKGTTKRFLEKKLGVKLTISTDGDIMLEGPELKTFLAEPVVKAVGRGFNPKVAVNLANEAYRFELLDIQHFTGKSKKNFVRIKARMIGTGGKARKTIEILTRTDIIIYGKTVGIIGKVEDALIARAAVEKLLGGAPHGNVYKYIEEEIKKKRW